MVSNVCARKKRRNESGVDRGGGGGEGWWRIRWRNTNIEKERWRKWTDTTEGRNGRNMKYKRIKATSKMGSGCRWNGGISSRDEADITAREQPGVILATICPMPGWLNWILQFVSSQVEARCKKKKSLVLPQDYCHCSWPLLCLLPLFIPCFIFLLFHNTLGIRMIAKVKKSFACGCRFVQKNVISACSTLL